MVYLQSTQVENGLKAKAVEYLKYLHGLEIIAGLNFKEARDGLKRLGLLDERLGYDLDQAFNEEVNHAVAVRGLLLDLGYRNKRELTGFMIAMRSRLEEALEPYEAECRPFVRILLNARMEAKFEATGLKQTWDALARLAGMDGNAKLRHDAWHFYLMVKAEEKWHVGLDQQVIGLYEQVFPHFDVRDAFMRLRAHGSPFNRALRARLAFLKASLA